MMAYYPREEVSSRGEQIDGCCQDQELGATLLQSSQASLGEAQLLLGDAEGVFHLGADVSLGLLTALPAISSLFSKP